MAAKQNGLVRTNAAARFEEEVPDFDHQPFMQNMMQRDTLTKYQVPCSTKGYCSKQVGTLKGSVELLHALLIKEIRDQIDKHLPPSMSKDFLCSGDVAIAVRYASNQDSPPHCKIFMLASMCLKPLNAVLASMEMSAVPDSEPADNELCFSALKTNDAEHIDFQTSWDMVVDLLKNQDLSKSMIYVNVLEHMPVHLVSSFKLLHTSNFKHFKPSSLQTSTSNGICKSNGNFLFRMPNADLHPA